MSERSKLKLRVSGIDQAPVITSEEGLKAAPWERWPLTLRDDEVSITEEDPEEEEVFSHENDAPEDYDISGSGMNAVGTFILVTMEELVDLLGGKLSDDKKSFLKASKKVAIEKAIRFRLKGGGWVVIPKAKGYVLYNANMSAQGGRFRLPFKFRALAQTGFDYDLIMNMTEEAKEPTEPAGGE